MPPSSGQKLIFEFWEEKVWNDKTVEINGLVKEKNWIDLLLVFLAAEEQIQKRAETKAFNEDKAVGGKTIKLPGSTEQGKTIVAPEKQEWRNIEQNIPNNVKVLAGGI